ncbi:unnamed protein product, partial [Ectocarpus sp. 12 AP-2014]
QHRRCKRHSPILVLPGRGLGARHLRRGRREAEEKAGRGRPCRARPHQAPRYHALPLRREKVRSRPGWWWSERRRGCWRRRKTGHPQAGGQQEERSGGGRCCGDKSGH